MRPLFGWLRGFGGRVGLARVRGALLLLFLSSVALSAFSYWREVAGRSDVGVPRGGGELMAEFQRNFLARYVKRYPKAAARLGAAVLDEERWYGALKEIALNYNTITIPYSCAFRVNLTVTPANAADLGYIWSRMERRFVLLDFTAPGVAFSRGVAQAPARSARAGEPPPAADARRNGSLARMPAAAVLVEGNGERVAALPLEFDSLWDDVRGDRIEELLGVVLLDPLRIRPVAARVRSRTGARVRHLFAGRLPPDLAITARFPSLAYGDRIRSRLEAMTFWPGDDDAGFARQEALLEGEFAALRLFRPAQSADDDEGGASAAEFDLLERLLLAEADLVRGLRLSRAARYEEAWESFDRALATDRLSFEARLARLSIAYHEKRDFVSAARESREFEGLRRDLAPEGKGHVVRAHDLLDAMRREHQHMMQPFDQRAMKPFDPERMDFQFKLPEWSKSLAPETREARLFVDHRAPPAGERSPADLARAYEQANEARTVRLTLDERVAAAALLGVALERLALEGNPSWPATSAERRRVLRRMLDDHDALFPDCRAIGRWRYLLFPKEYDAPVSGE
ncbi:MAG: hypothetical protein HY719_03025 [Planctomycetes bacterium]|nr:hypothetical protein [Planctomycetota bacterium]